MWYAIIGGAGLAAGIGLMIWALRERSRCMAAERELRNADEARAKAERISDHNRDRAMDLERQVKLIDTQLAVLRGRLNETRMRLAQSGDPKAIKEWLDYELKEGKL